MVSVRDGAVTTVPIPAAVARLKTVDPASEIVRAARDVGVSFAAADGSDDAHFASRKRHGAP